MLLIKRSLTKEVENDITLRLGKYTLNIDREYYNILRRDSDNIIITPYQGLSPDISKLDELNLLTNDIKKFLITEGRKGLIETLNDVDDILDGKYLILNTSEEYIARDPLGLQSSYMYKDMIADNKKQLTKNGEKAYSIPPNFIFKNYNGTLEPIRKLIDLPPKTLKPRFTLDEMSKIYLEYILSRTCKIIDKERIKEVSISYSGGVDSSLVTWLALQTGIEVNLLVAGSKKSIDVKNIEKTSSIFKNTQLKTILLEEDEVEKELPNIIRITEEYSPVSISVAVTQYFVLRNTSTKSVFLGQGSDEMFGGYSKYIENYHIAENLIRQDLLRSYKLNFEREDKISRWFRKRIYYPLISPSTLYLSLLTPLDYKIKSSYDDTRKWIIRKAAKIAGLPRDVYLRKKHSLQYSSRSMEILRRIAKRREVTVTRLLYEIYKTVMKNGHNI